MHVIYVTVEVVLKETKETHIHGPNVRMGSSPTLPLASGGKPLPAIQRAERIR
jgi:hypothetical protein